MSSQRSGRLMIVSHLDGAPANDEWEDLLSFFEREHLDRLRLVVFTEGGGPTPAQQARLASALASRPGALYVAVISDCTGIRFMASTIALFVRRLKTFRQSELESALTYLQLAPIERRQVLRFVGKPSQERLSITP